MLLALQADNVRRSHMVRLPVFLNVTPTVRVQGEVSMRWEVLREVIERRGEGEVMRRRPLGEGQYRAPSRGLGGPGAVGRFF